MIKNILISGTVQGIARFLITEALHREYNVTALLSDPEKLGITHKDLELIKGSILNYVDVRSAVAGQDVVILAEESQKITSIGIGTQNMIQAMEEMHVFKLICLSSIGAGSTANRMGVLFQLIVKLKNFQYWLEAKGEQEHMLTQSNLNYTVVQVGHLTNSETDIGKIRVIKPDQIPRSFFSTPGRLGRTAVAHFIIAQLLSDYLNGETVSLVI